MLDEPSEGIQPSIVNEIVEHLRELSAKRNLAILLVEQDLQLVERIAHRVVVMRKGKLVSELPVGDVADRGIVKEMLGNQMLSLRKT
jgi:branched-chain amino acid transport system ATP-binding protein